MVPLQVNESGGSRAPPGQRVDGQYATHNKTADDEETSSSARSQVSTKGPKCPLAARVDIRANAI